MTGTSENLFLTCNEFAEQVKREQKDFRNRTVTGAADFRNFKKKRLNISTTSFSDGIQIDLANTDFRRFEPSVNWLDTMPIIFVDKNGDGINTTVTDLFKALEDAYYEKRGGKGKKFNKTDFFKNDLAKFSTIGEKLFYALRHIQEYEHRNPLFKLLTKRRSHDALQTALETLRPAVSPIDVTELAANQSVLVGNPSRLTESRLSDLHDIETTSSRNSPRQSAEAPTAHQSRYDSDDDEKIPDATQTPQPVVSEKPVTPPLVLQEYFDAEGKLVSQKIIDNPVRFKTAFSRYINADENHKEEKEVLARKITAATEQAESLLKAALVKKTYAFNHETTAAYIFLKQANESVVQRYDCWLKTVGLPWYLKAVVYAEKKNLGGIAALLRESTVFVDAQDKLSHRRVGVELFQSSHKIICQERWANMPLSTVLAAECGNRHALAAAEKTAIENEFFYKQLQLEKYTQCEKKYYVAELIARGKFGQAMNELNAYQTTWPDASQSIRAEAIQIATKRIVDAAFIEAKEKVYCDSTKFSRYRDNLTEMSAFKKLRDFNKTLFATEESKKRETDIFYDVVATRAMNQVLIEFFTGNKKIKEVSLRELQKYVGVPFQWMGSCNAGGYPTIKLNMPEKETVITDELLKKDNRRCKTRADIADALSHLLETGFSAPLKREDGSVISSIEHAVYAVNTAIQSLQDAMAQIWTYEKIQWARDSQGKFFPGLEFQKMPKKYYATRFWQFKNYPGTKENVNFMKYQHAFVLQNALDSAVRNLQTNPNQAEKEFEKILCALDATHQMLAHPDVGEKGHTFDILINDAVVKVEAATAQWKQVMTSVFEPALKSVTPCMKAPVVAASPVFAAR